jgi:hypothetical protein|tara:strand:+ start:1931 stop:2329 length:399 start_codon:yes stop_codon:yes gene_type:complete
MMTEQVQPSMSNNTVTPNQYYGKNPGVYTPPLNCHYTQLPTVGVSDEIMKISIGKNGSVFKAITNQANVNYVWYNKESLFVEIWGPEQNLPDATKRVFDRIQKIITKVANGEIVLKNKTELIIKKENAMDMN